MNDFSSNDIKAGNRRLMGLAILVFPISVLGLFAAEIIPSERSSTAVFTGQVLSDELIASMTNVFSAQHAQYGLYGMTELRVARIRMESVIKHDEPIPLRFPDEVPVYYFWNKNQQCPRPVRLATGLRKKFYCDRRNLVGRTKCSDRSCRVRCDCAKRLGVRCGETTETGALEASALVPFVAARAGTNACDTADKNVCGTDYAAAAGGGVSLSLTRSRSFWVVKGFCKKSVLPVVPGTCA